MINLDKLKKLNKEYIAKINILKLEVEMLKDEKNYLRRGTRII